MKDFQTFRQEIKPRLAILEEERLLTQKKVKNVVVVMLSIIGGVIAIALLFTKLNDHSSINPFPIFILIILVLGIGFWQRQKHIKKFKDNFKNHVIAQLVKAINPSLSYSHKSYISREKFVGSNIFLNRTDRYSGEDYVHGMQDKTEIEFSEVHAKEKHTSTDSKGRRQTRYVTFFKGLFMIADFHKEFHGRTVVLPDTAESMFGWIGKKLQKMNMGRDQLVYMENTEFEKHFVVYSTDQVEARYILSTSMIDRMLELKQRLNCKLYFSFMHSKVNIAISTGTNFFEPKLKESLLESGALERFYNELMLCLGLVEDLNLNTRIWGKG